MDRAILDFWHREIDNYFFKGLANLSTVTQCGRQSFSGRGYAPRRLEETNLSIDSHTPAS